MWFLIFLVSLAEAKIESTIKTKNPDLSLTREDCRQLIINNKPDDSVEYKAGVDVKGKPVVPADLPGSKTYGLGDKVVIPLEMPLKKYAPSFPPGSNQYVDSTIGNSKIYTGVIDVDKDGSAKINGQTVEDEDQEGIRKECKKKFPDVS